MRTTTLRREWNSPQWISDSIGLAANASAVAGTGVWVARGFACPAFCPMAQCSDLTVHQLSQGHTAGHGFDDILGLGLPAVGVCLVQGIDEYRLNFGTGELPRKRGTAPRYRNPRVCGRGA